jgi:hypothetical protein
MIVLALRSRHPAASVRIGFIRQFYARAGDISATGDVAPMSCRPTHNGAWAWRTSTAWRLPVTMASSPFANTITQLNCCWARGGLDQQVRAFVGRVTDSRRIRVNARYVENRLPIAISSGVGPVRHPVGAHAPGKIQHASRNLRYLGLGRLEQLCAGSLGGLELGSADPDLLWGDLRHPSPSGGIREGRHAVRAHAVGEGDSLGARRLGIGWPSRIR